MSVPASAHVKRYVQKNIKAIRSIRDVARALRVSVETLRKDFRRRTGVPLSSYILDVRIVRLKRALARSRRRCFEIIFAAGFAREDSAARTFRARTGMTMEQYRRRARRSAAHRKASRKCKPRSST